MDCCSCVPDPEVVAITLSGGFQFQSHYRQLLTSLGRDPDTVILNGELYSSMDRLNDAVLWITDLSSLQNSVGVTAAKSFLDANKKRRMVIIHEFFPTSNYLSLFNSLGITLFANFNKVNGYTDGWEKHSVTIFPGICTPLGVVPEWFAYDFITPNSSTSFNGCNGGYGTCCIFGVATGGWCYNDLTGLYSYLNSLCPKKALFLQINNISWDWSWTLGQPDFSEATTIRYTCPKPSLGFGWHQADFTSHYLVKDLPPLQYRTSFLFDNGTVLASATAIDYVRPTASVPNVILTEESHSEECICSETLSQEQITLCAASKGIPVFDGIAANEFYNILCGAYFISGCQGLINGLYDCNVGGMDFQLYAPYGSPVTCYLNGQVVSCSSIASNLNLCEFPWNVCFGNPSFGGICGSCQWNPFPSDFHGVSLNNGSFILCDGCGQQDLRGFVYVTYPGQAGNPVVIEKIGDTEIIHLGSINVAETTNSCDGEGITAPFTLNAEFFNRLYPPYWPLQ
jgi:hypothetical protein